MTSATRIATGSARPTARGARRAEPAAEPDRGAGGPLARYRRGDFLFQAADYTMLGGPGEPVDSGATAHETVSAVQGALRDVPRSAVRGARRYAVGAVPFDVRRPAALTIPESVTITGSAPRTAGGHARPGGMGRFEISAVPTEEDHVRAVRAALIALEEDPLLDKLVLARSLELRGATVDPEAVVGVLAARHPHAYTFAAELPAVCAGGPDGAGVRAGPSAPRRRTLVGASPELLVSLRDGVVRTRPHAGSAARSADPEEDRRRARALLASAKDRYEHAIVVDEIAAALRPLCSTLEVPPEPTLARTPTMWHLATAIEGRAASPGITSLDLAMAVHPTPAICGRQPERAHRAIERIEGFDRGFYTGFVGWTDEDGDGEWAIAIRCAEIDEERVRLFAGGGIVAASDPHAELAETTAKLRTMLDALASVPA